MMGVLMLTVLGSIMSWSTFCFIVGWKVLTRSVVVLHISTAVHAVVVTCRSAISSYFLGPWPMTSWCEYRTVAITSVCDEH